MKMSQKQKIKKPRYFLKYQIFRTLGFISLVLPLFLVIWEKREDYFKMEIALKTSFGTVAALAVVIIVVTGHSKVLKGLLSWFIVFILAYLLEVVIKDLVLLSGAALLGRAIYLIIFQYPIARYKRLYEARESAMVQATVYKETFTQQNYNGRV